MDGKKSKFEYVNFLNYLFLTFLRKWSNLVRLFFFRRFSVFGKENINLDKPVIFTVNHQSAFLDPMLIGMTSGRKPWYITRAGVFNGKLVKYILRSIHMLPIYRLRDKVDINKANESTFSECHDILSGRGSVIIFPEGNHGMRKTLRAPLKKGFARIALDAEAKNDFNLGLEIIPTGIYYEHPTKIRSDCYVYYGKPFTIKHLKDKYLENPKEAYNLLTKELEMILPDYMIDIKPFERYDEIEEKWMRNRPKERNLWERFTSDKKILDSLSKGESIKEFPKRGINPALRMALLILGFPLFLLGFINNFISFYLTKYILNTMMKDAHYTHSIKFACGLSVVPLATLAQGLIVLYFFDVYIFLAYILITPIIGVLAYDYYDLLIRKESYFKISTLADKFPQMR